jgi:uncharacterized protein YqiB (DUF1249 family)
MFGKSPPSEHERRQQRIFEKNKVQLERMLAPGERRTVALKRAEKALARIREMCKTGDVNLPDDLRNSDVRRAFDEVLRLLHALSYVSHSSSQEVLREDAAAAEAAKAEADRRAAEAWKRAQDKAEKARIKALLADESLDDEPTAGQ